MRWTLLQQVHSDQQLSYTAIMIHSSIDVGDHSNACMVYVVNVTKQNFLYCDFEC